MGLKLSVRLWLARRHAGTCDAMPIAGSVERCGRSAVGCVRILGRPKRVCDIHLVPLESIGEGGGLVFLAAFYGVPLSPDAALTPIVYPELTDRT